MHRRLAEVILRKKGTRSRRFGLIMPMVPKTVLGSEVSTMVTSQRSAGLLFLCALSASAQTPVIGAITTVAGKPEIAEDTWCTIYGTHLTPANTPANGVYWYSSPLLAQGIMPTELGGVSVTVNGVPAYISFLCSSTPNKSICAGDQINILTPIDFTTGPVDVVVTNGGISSDPFSVEKNDFVPSFFLYDAQGDIAAQHANYSVLGPTTLVPGISTPGKPGEVVLLYATGFGASDNPVPGALQQSADFTGSINCFIDVDQPGGGNDFPVISATMISPGLFQINAQIPKGTSTGNHYTQCANLESETTGAGLLAVDAVPAGGFSLSGHSFFVNGTLTIGNQTASIQVSATAETDIIFSIGITTLSNPPPFFVGFSLLNITPTVMGKQISFTGTATGGLYSPNASPNYSDISSVTIVLVIDSSTDGSKITGTTSFVVGNTTVNGTITGTLSLF